MKRIDRLPTAVFWGLVICAQCNPEATALAKEPAVQHAATAPKAKTELDEEVAVQLSVLPRIAIESHNSSNRKDLRPVVFFVRLNEEQLRDLRGRLVAAGFDRLVFRTDLGPGKRSATLNSGLLRDWKTGKPAAVLSVKIRKIEGDRATGAADYYVGGEWARGFAFECEKRDGKWVLVKLKDVWVS